MLRQKKVKKNTYRPCAWVRNRELGQKACDDYLELLGNQPLQDELVT